MKVIREAAIISFFELSPAWQAEAVSNMDQELAEQAHYIEPAEDHIPGEHVLWDLTEAMPVKGCEFNAAIPWSNACCMYLKISDCGESVQMMVED